MDEKTILYLTLITFPIIWFITIGLISVFGGWSNLASKYPPRAQYREIIKSFSMQSLRLGFFSGYNSCLNITFYREGMLIVPVWILRFRHDPIFIPFDRIKTENTSDVIVKRLVFHLDGIKISIFGKAARHLQEVLSCNE